MTKKPSSGLAPLEEVQKVCRRVYDYRCRHNFSRAVVGELLGVSEQMIMDLENNHVMSAKTIKMMDTKIGQYESIELGETLIKSLPNLRRYMSLMDSLSLTEQEFALNCLTAIAIQIKLRKPDFLK